MYKSSWSPEATFHLYCFSLVTIDSTLPMRHITRNHTLIIPDCWWHWLFITLPRCYWYRFMFYWMKNNVLLYSSNLTNKFLRQNRDIWSNEKLVERIKLKGNLRSNNTPFLACWRPNPMREIERFVSSNLKREGSSQIIFWFRKYDE